MTAAAALALCACIERDRGRERESVFTAALCLHWTSRKRESSFLQFTVCYTQKKNILSTLRRTTIALSLSLTLFAYYFVVYAWCCFFYLLYSFISYFCLLLSAPLLRCCCCFFFFFYIVTNTQKQLKNNNIKKYRNRRTCWTVVVVVVAGESVVFVFVFVSLFVCCFLFVENFEFWFCAKCFFSRVAVSPARLPVKSPPRLLFKHVSSCWRSLFVFLLFHSFIRGEQKKKLFTNTQIMEGEEVGGKTNTSQNVLKNFSLFF